jgi:hypothetical protein
VEGHGWMSEGRIERQIYVMHLVYGRRLQGCTKQLRGLIVVYLIRYELPTMKQQLNENHGIRQQSHSAAQRRKPQSRQRKGFSRCHQVPEEGKSGRRQGNENSSTQHLKIDQDAVTFKWYHWGLHCRPFSCPLNAGLNSGALKPNAFVD